MSLWPPRQPDTATHRPDASAAGRNTSRREIAPRAASGPEQAPDDHGRQASQSLVAAKQFDVYGLIG